MWLRDTEHALITHLCHQHFNQESSTWPQFIKPKLYHTVLPAQFEWTFCSKKQVFALPCEIDVAILSFQRLVWCFHLTFKQFFRDRTAFCKEKRTVLSNKSKQKLKLEKTKGRKSAHREWKSDRVHEICI